MAKWSTSTALKAINNARADIAKRKEEDGESFTYEPWAVPDEETQANQAEEINRRYTELQQNGASDAILAARQSVADSNAAYKNMVEENQRQREQEQTMLQNALTVGSLDSYKAYKNASADQQTALANIYTAQNQTLTGYDRFAGNKTGTYSATKLADQFKSDYGVSDDDYNTLMDGYNTYRQAKSKQATNAYSSLTDSQKTLLDEISESQSSKQGSAVYRAQSKINQLKQETGVDDDTVNNWQSLRNDEKNTRVSASKASQISSDEINKLDREARAAIDDYMKGYQQSQTAAGTGSLFENIKGQLTNPFKQTKAIIEGGDLMESARQRLKELGYSDSDIKKYEEYAQVYAEDNLMEKDKSNAQKHPLSSNVNAILTDATLGMANGITQFINDTIENATGKNTNSSPNNFGVGHGFGARASRYASNVQEGTQKAINNGDDENSTLVQKVGKELYNMGYSAAQSNLTNIVGALGSAALGSNIAGELASLVPAFGNTYYQSKMNAEERGLSNDKAYQTAFAEARHEVETETLSDRVLGLMFKEDTVKNILKETLKGAAEEGGEEVTNNILNAITDRVINGDKSELNQTVQNYMAQGATQQEAIIQTATDFIKDSAYDFLTAAGSTIIGMAPNAAARTIDNRVTGNSVFGSNTAQDYRDLQESYDLDESKASYPQVKKAYDLAGKYAEKLENGGKVTTSERAKLWDITNGIAGIEQTAAENEERDEKRTKLKNDIKDGFKGIFNRSENTTQTETTTAEQTPTTEHQTETTGSAQGSVSGTENYVPAETHTTYNDAYKAIQSATTQEELNDAVQDAKASTEISEEDYARLRETAGSYAASKNNLNMEVAEVSTEDAYNEGYQNPNAENPYTGISSKNAIAFNEAQQRSKEDQEARKAQNKATVEERAKLQLNSVTSDFMSSHYNEEIDPAVYSDVIESALTAGRTAADINETALSNPGVALVGEDLVRQAYATGAEVAAKEMIYEEKNSAAMTKGVTFGTGTFSDKRHDKSTTIGGLETLEVLAKVTGLDIELTDDENVVKGGENGHYAPSNSTVYLNAEQAHRLAGTSYHEAFGEFAATWNQKEYTSTVNSILAAAQKHYGAAKYNAIRNRYAAAYKAVEKTKTDIDLDKEMANDLLYKFFESKEGMQELMDEIDRQNGAKEAKSIKEKLAEWLKNLADAIRDFMSTFTPNEFQRGIAEANIEHIESLRKEVMQTVAGAIRNYNEARAKAEQQSIKDAIGLDDDGRRTAGESIGRSLVVDDGVDMDDIDDFVDTVMANNGQSGRKYNQVTIKELNETDIENIRKATGGRVDASGKHYALEGSKLFHEIRNHSESSHNQHSWQLTYERNNVPEIIETMLHPDIVEDLGDVYTEDQRENIAFVKEQNGSYIVVVAVGGRRNKAITAEMILRFKTEELNERLKNGTVAELIYAEAAKKLSEEQLNSIKKNRVTAVIHESLDSFSQTSKTILRSPLFEENVAQNVANGNVVNTNNAGDILYDGNVATESQIEESDIGIRRSVRIDDPPKKTITAYKVFVAFENDPGHLYPPMVASPGGVATPVGVWLDADTGTMARDKEGNIIVNSKGRVQVQQGGKGTNKAKSGTLAWRPGWHLGEYPDAKQFAVKDPVTGKAKSAFPAHFIFAECEIAADVDYQLEAMEYGVSEKGGFNRTQAGLPYVPKNGSYRYRTNADPTTAPWYITGSMKVNRILDDADIREICAKFGVTPLPRVGGDIDLSKYGFKRGEVTSTEDLSNLPVSEDYSEEIKQLPGYVRRKLNFDDPTVMKEFEIDHISRDKVAEYAAGYNKRNSLDIDSDDNTLTESQQKYFENSKVRDEDGRLLVMYHGTGADFTEFDRKYIGSHGSFEGYGFNFTPDKSRASGYSNGRILEGYLNVTNPLSDSEITMTTREFANLIAEADPTGDDIIANYAMNTRDYGTPAFVKREAMTTAKLIMESAQSDVDLYSEISAAGGGDNLIDLFKRMGYDGLIHHNENGSIKTVITFESNQFKNVDNQNPTQAADIRRAVGIDEFDFEQFGDPLLNDLTEDELREWLTAGGEQEAETNGTTDLVSALRSSNEVLKGGKVNKADIRKIARQIKSQYGSNINVDTLAENLAKIFDYAQSRDYINYEDLATVIAEVAAPVIDGSVNKVGAKEFDSFKNTLKGYAFKLNERQENEVIRAFGSWGAFRKQLPGVKFVRGDSNGIALDSVWDSLCKESGYVLDSMVTSNDMPLVLVDAYNSMRPTYQNAFGEDAERATQDAAMEIVSKYYQYAADQEKTALKKEQRQRLIDQSDMLKKQNEETRKKLQQQYKERLEKEVAKLKQEGKSEKVSVQVARLRARNARTVASLRESQKRKEQLRTLNKNAAKLVEWVSNPTDKNHIPKMMQTPVLELVAAMDFVPQTVRETADGKYSIRLLESRHVNEDGSYSYTWKTITADTVQEAVEAYKKAMNDFGLGSASNKKWQERMQTIQDLYQQNEEDEWFEKSELKQGLDKNLGEQLDDILKNNRGMLSIAELSSDELQTINDVVRNVMHAVNQMNRMYSQPSQKVTDVSHEVMDRAYQQKAKGRRAHGDTMNDLLDLLTLDNATPETFFHGLFGGDETDPITKTMLKAQNQKARDIRQAQEYMSEYMTKDIKDVVKDWMYSKTGDHNIRNFYGMDLTTTQVMSLYELMKRPDAQQHKIGGFMVDETGRKTDGRHKVVHLTDEQITSITDTLSEEQKRIADAMQYYMAHQCAEQGNETAMQLYGYEKYLDEHYFPMAADKNTIATKDSNVTTGAVNAIKNSDFTKKITPNANNPLILKDIFTVFSDHVSDMATYHSWAAPLQDILRFYNYNEKTNVDKGGQTFIERRSTKDAFDYFYGKSGQQYMTKLLSSINQMEKSNLVGGKFMERMTGNAKTAAVMGNIRVVVQQPTAFFRAGEMISYKYLNDGLAGKYVKEAAELRDRTSDVFWLKNQGNIDGYITQGMVSTITGVQTFKEGINEWAGKLASKADEITWAAMYRAVYSEQVDKLGKNKVGTEEFENAVNDRFSEIMLRTQVYDGTITRSQFMRSTDWYNKIASAFMAEPTKTYNILLRHLIDLSQADSKTAVATAKKGIAKAAYVLTLTNFANAVAQSLMDAVRNAGDADDDDKNFWERFLEAFGFEALVDDEDDTLLTAAEKFMSGNFMDNMDMLSNIPLVADTWDAVKSGFKSLSGGSTYSSDSDLSMSGINNFFKAAKAIINPSEKMTTYGRFAAVARGFSDMTGIPLYAVQRDVVAAYNTIAKDIMNGLAGMNLPVLQKTSKYTKAQQAKQDVYEGVITDVYENAVNSGDYKEAIENAVEQGSSYKSIKQSLKSNTQDIYVRLLKTDPSEATKMKNRLAQMYTYLDEKTDVRTDKTEAEKLEYHKGEIDKWKADWEEKQAEEQK